MTKNRISFRTERLNDERWNRRWTQKRLAAEIGVSDSSLSALLKGTTHPRTRTIANVLANLGGTFDEWFEIEPLEIELVEADDR